ncbi:hypothetical protein ACSVIJ_05215 [Pseudomonas sp. NCHU5208]|uniref:hypothetical protein n=1 Tax=unclassified Pseudomonas TaxID=196821 RepID=UPI003F9DE875
MTNAGRNIESLIAVAKRLHNSPHTGSERACIVRLQDGTERLAVTKLVNTKQHGTEHNGASFYRVSFKFAGESEADYSQEQDVVWCIVDHKEANIVFGPTEGIQVSVKGIGIGSYLLAQVIRLVSQAELRGNYQVHAVQLPLPAQRSVPDDDVKANNGRIEAFLTRAGFYVSPAGGAVTVGVRRQKDLKSWWNQEKVRFLGFPQFVELASRWQAEKLKADLQLAAALQTNAAQAQQIATLTAERRASAEQQTALDEQHTNTVQQLSRRISELELEAEALAKSPAATPANDCPPPALRTDLPLMPTAQQNVTIGLSRGLMRLLWTGLALAGAGLLLSAMTIMLPSVG